ncbi:unnamed protein product [Sphagnum jensenii]|uniref:Uncharacterized protein n=1 Tax=Sphagnum jensenii TaxID=128206 RepID=A0ABP1BPN8_9BRYO
MAFEVARVHGIIRSNIREDGTCISKATETAASLVQEEAALSCAKATQLTGAHLSYLPGDMHLLHSSAAAAAACWPDVPSSPLTSSSSPRSTETESIGDDDPLAGLVEQVAQTMLEGDEGLNQRPRRSSTRTHSEASAPSTCDMEANKAVGSPQSSWSSGSSSSMGHSWLSTSNAASSKGSSRVSSQVSSPPTTPVDPQQSDAWDLLYAAAGEVVRLKRNEQQQQKRPLSSFPVSRYHQQHVQSQHQPQAFSLQQQVPPSQMGAGGAGSRFLQSRQYPIHHQQHQAARSGVVGKGCQGQYRSERFMDYNNTSKWTAANGGGSGMRAVFLGSGGSGRESSGTGVFLPRCAGNGPELKRKSVCSTVLLPSRIVQVLNLNVDNMSSHPPLPSSFVHSAAHTGKPSLLFKSVLHVNAGPELSLPSEWTY